MVRWHIFTKKNPSRLYIQKKLIVHSTQTLWQILVLEKLVPFQMIELLCKIFYSWWLLVQDIYIDEHIYDNLMQQFSSVTYPQQLSGCMDICWSVSLPLYFVSPFFSLGWTIHKQAGTKMMAGGTSMHAWTLYVERDGSVAAQSPLAVGVAMLHAACCVHLLSMYPLPCAGREGVIPSLSNLVCLPNSDKRACLCLLCTCSGCISDELIVWHVLHVPVELWLKRYPLGSRVACYI
jgi:hypothetical protein